jgi:methyl-accepting chemotaxis protein
MTSSSSLSRAFACTCVAAIAALVGFAAAWLAMPGVEVAAIGIAALAAGLALTCFAALKRFLGEVGEVSQRVARGDFEARILDIKECGDMGRLRDLINAMIDHCDAFIREADASMHAVSQNRFFRRVLPRGMHGAFLHAAENINAATDMISNRVRAFDAATGKFEATAGAIIKDFTDASREMSGTADRLERGAAGTRERVATVAAASEQATVNMQTVAAATTELTNSAAEISQEVARSTETARQAAEIAGAAGRSVTELNTAAERIGDVVKLITAVAAQTNLLALNATIEAARAGEMGKGFAVVAQEVKALAAQTTGATTEISGHIENVQQSTHSAVAAIERLGKMVSEVASTTGRVAAAVTSQTAATSEIANNVEQAFAGMRDITSSVHTVSENAGETAQHAATTKGASDNLSRQSARLADEIGKFLLSMREALLNRRAVDGAATDGTRPAARAKAA